MFQSCQVIAARSSDSINFTRYSFNERIAHENGIAAKQKETSVFSGTHFLLKGDECGHDVKSCPYGGRSDSFPEAASVESLKNRLSIHETVLFDIR